jgi:hypothetical protein
MRWERLGRIFTPSGERDWMVSHASVPYAERLEGDLFRIYFTPRDRGNRSYLGWLDVELTRPDRIVRLAEAPLLGPGEPGSFDDCGTLGSWLVEADGGKHHYYIGWNRRSPMPFHVSIGRATTPAGADAGAPLEKLPGPVLERGLGDPLFCSNPCVLHEAGHWRMWYLSGLGWETVRDAASASYHIRHAESPDGVHWRRSDGVAIGLVHPDEIAIARPTVLRDGDGYSMWYCWRGRSFPYRLGYATSPDGISWTRRDNAAGLALADSGWDSDMIAYPYVFEHRGERYMLYCGNGFGRAGFGLAVQSSSP